MAETGHLAAWVGQEKGFEIREYPYHKILSHTHITRGAIAPN
jgi:hypothetical protein